MNIILAAGDSEPFSMGDTIYLTAQAEDVERARAYILALEAEIARLKAENACDGCGGDGKSISDKPCMCGGTGKASYAALWLREQLVTEERLHDLTKAKLLEWDRVRLSERDREAPVSAPRPDIEGLERLSEKATPGPWESWKDNCGPYVDREQVEHKGYYIPELLSLGNGECGSMKKLDADLTVALRNAFPTLAAYVRELEKLCGLERQEPIPAAPHDSDQMDERVTLDPKQAEDRLTFASVMDDRGVRMLREGVRVDLDLRNPDHVRLLFPSLSEEEIRRMVEESG